MLCFTSRLVRDLLDALSVVVALSGETLGAFSAPISPLKVCYVHTVIFRLARNCSNQRQKIA